jgi:hypothetical protein
MARHHRSRGRLLAVIVVVAVVLLLLVWLALQTLGGDSSKDGTPVPSSIS